MEGRQTGPRQVVGGRCLCVGCVQNDRPLQGSAMSVTSCRWNGYGKTGDKLPIEKGTMDSGGGGVAGEKGGREPVCSFSYYEII